MSTRKNLIDLSPVGMNFYIKKTAADTDGEALELEWEVFPGQKGTPVHTHPHASESYRVLEGEMEVYVDGEWSTLSAGESATVEKGIPHTFQNLSERTARVHNIHSPALKMQDYFEELETLVHSGALNPPDLDLKSIMHLCLLMTLYPREIRQVQPPPPVVSLLGLMARVLGYQENIRPTNGKA